MSMCFFRGCYYASADKEVIAIAVFMLVVSSSSSKYKLHVITLNIIFDDEVCISCYKSVSLNKMFFGIICLCMTCLLLGRQNAPAMVNQRYSFIIIWLACGRYQTVSNCISNGSSIKIF